MKRNYSKANTFLTAFCVTMIVVLTLVLFMQFENKHIEPYIKNICQTNGKQEVVRIITSSIDEVMLKQDDLHNDFVTISTDENSNVKSIQTNTVKINAIENEIIRQINKNFTDSEKTTFKFPVGNMTGIYTLAGKGFNIKLKILPLSDIKAEVKSGFESVGINQVKHNLTLVITADTTMLMPAYKDYSQVTVEYILAETVVVGEVPDYIRGY
ncbi:MAG: sporulation protein YunB [Oscillospiraceae bacterium]|jgi:sporulation protein YunB|nr:sporulation protein YunB [Oscillospiraceae bacterium]